MKFFRRFLIILIILVYNELFNLFAIKDIYIGPITLWDVVGLLVLSYLFLELVVNQTKYRNIENRKAIMWINWLIVFILIITLSMPFRGESLSNAFLMSRKIIIPYLMIHIFIIDILRAKSTHFLENVLLFSSILFSIVFILKLVTSISFINQDGFAYITATFILFYWKNYFKQTNKLIIPILVILFIGLFAQPFRAYAFSSIGLILGFTLLQRKFKKIIKYIIFLTLLIAIAFPISNNFDKYSISNQVDTLILDLTKGGEKSSTGARLVKDMIYRIPMIAKEPLWGYGFIHPKGVYAKQLGFYLEDEYGIDAYNLYTVDSGYLTFLTTYGFIGTLIILFIFFKIAILVYYSNIFRAYKYSFITLLLSFIATTYTHHPLMTDFGIIPLMLLLSFTTITQKEKFNYAK